MTSIDQYSSACNDCANRWTSFVGVSTNTFGMTTAEAEALVPAICLAIWLSEQRTEIEEEAREEELSRLSTEVPYQHRLL